MKVALSTQIQAAWPLERHAQVAASIGYDALEIVLGPPHAEAAYVESEAPAIAAMLGRHGLAAACLTTTTHLDGSQGAEDAVKRTVRTAPRLGAPLVKIPSGPPSSKHATDADFARCAGSLRRSSREAAEVGVVLTVETHLNMLTDTLTGTQRLLRETTRGDMRALARSLGVTYDITNVHTSGDGPVAGVDALADWIRLVHLKDGRVSAEGVEWCPIGFGEVGLLGALCQLKVVGYDGYVSVECLLSAASYVCPSELDTPEEIAQHDHDRVRELLARV